MQLGISPVHEAAANWMYAVFLYNNNGEFGEAGIPRHPRCDVTYTGFHCVLKIKV